MNPAKPAIRKRRSLARAAAVACVVSAFALALASPALAEDPTAAQYSASVTHSSESRGPGSPSADTSGLQSSVVGGLPFTGLDLIALAAVAAAFTSVGFALRRMTVSKHADRTA
jgi:hypothetical protein